MHIRHKNENTFDNRIENLEEKSHQEIQVLSTKKKARSLLSLRGVSFLKSIGKFTAQVQVYGVRHYLGCFKTEQEAHQSYLNAKAKYLQTQMLDDSGN